MEPDTVLVAIGNEDADRIDAVTRTVRKLADPSDARVVVAHVVPEAEYDRAVDAVSVESRAESRVTMTPISPTVESPSAPARDRELSEEEVLEAVVNERSVVRDLADALDDAGVAHEIRGGVGDPADQVVELAEDLNPDFVVVGGRDRSTARQALFGSVSQEIIRSVIQPVVTVRGT